MDLSNAFRKVAGRGGYGLGYVWRRLGGGGGGVELMLMQCIVEASREG